MGNREAADMRILEALEAGLYDQVDAGVIVKVEIFQANPVTGAKTGLANSYDYRPLLACKWDPCPDPDNGSPPDYGSGTWIPAIRQTTLNPGGGGLDVLGVEVTYDHDPITNLFSFLDRNFAERALVRLEPDTFGSGP